MDFNLASIEAADRYKLLNSVIIPRPIAWITSVDEAGVVNAAPFSWFNLMGVNPPIVTVGPQYRHNFKEGLKDTPRNIRSGGAFVINIANEELAEKMDRTSDFYPAGISEADDQNLGLAPSAMIGVPRIAAAPASIECRERTTMLIGNTWVIIADVLHLWIKDELIDPKRFHVDMDLMEVIGRGGAGRYIRTTDFFGIDDKNRTAGLLKAKNKGL